MVIEEMTDRECRAMLSRANLARLACALSNQPYVVPIHVELDDEFLYGFATLGQKIEWMRQNPLVCLEVDELTTDRQWATIVIFGVYEELPDTPEHEYTRRVAEDLFQRRPGWWEPASVPVAGHEQRSRVVFRIEISRMSGRRARPAASETPVLVTHVSHTPDAGRLAGRLRRAWGRLRAPLSRLSPGAEIARSPSTARRAQERVMTIEDARKQLLEGLNQDLQGEFQAIIMYRLYASMVQGPYRQELRTFFANEIPDELTHAQILADKITVLGGTPAAVPAPVAVVHEAKAMLEAALAAEVETIGRYVTRRAQAEAAGEHGLAADFDTIIADESKHRDELRLMLGRWP